MRKSYQEFLDYLDVISDRGVRPSLDRMKEAVSALGHPENTYPVIHIAGTNGKGTTCFKTAELLAFSGYRTGLILSPHVDDYRERIQISDPVTKKIQLISEDDLLRTHKTLLKKIADTHQLTYFEWGVLLAMQYFAEQNVDIAVLETGLGGRWDATNVVATSLISGITTIGLDHTEFLGPTKLHILTEKLQIIKPNTDFIFGPTDPELVSMAQQHCAAMDTRFLQASDLAENHVTILPAHLQGNCQGDNHLFVIALAKVLEAKGYKLDVRNWLAQTHTNLPARLEIICADPFIMRDGAHNEEGLKRLKEYVTTRFADDYDLVFSCLKSRDFLSLANIIKSPHQNYWARIDAGIRTTEDDVFFRVRDQLGGEVVTLDNDFKNLLLARQKNRPVVVCGSFYLCSQFKSLWEQA